jgi:pyruvate,water dikinase
MNSMPAGMRRVFSELGAPLETIDVRFVHGHFYSRLRPLISPDKPAKRLPPLAVLKVATRLHPEMRRRNRRAGLVRVGAPWNAVIADWHAGGKATIAAGNVALQDVHLAELSDDAAVAHARICLDHCAELWQHHFWLHGFDLGPLGQFLFEALKWGIDPNDLLSLLEGASPSTSAPARVAIPIRRSVEATGASPTSLDELRALSPEISAAVDGFLKHRGAVLFSRYDIDGVTLGERPDLVFASIMRAEEHDATEAVQARTKLVREAVPAEHRARFDEILRQARSAMDLRDDNGPTTAEWPLGLLRLSLLEVGRRLVSAGKIDDQELALELTPDELLPGLIDSPPTADELRARLALRVSQRSLDAPLLLGPDELAPPLEVLPEHLAHVVGMVQTVMLYMGMDGAPTASGLHGSGVGDRTVVGRAVVASSPEEAFDLLGPGDVLVVHSTTPAYNLVLSLAAAVVTVEGGPMSHAAVLARELGIPAVVGARSALTDIANGAMVEVDPVAGEVRLIPADV